MTTHENTRPTVSLPKRFSDLGRATLRGIRKCPKCGRINGTRGFICKNPECKTILKSSTVTKCKQSEAVQIHTGTSTKIYSICVSRGEPLGWYPRADTQGFVQLPSDTVRCVCVDSATFAITFAADANKSEPLCFVGGCRRQFDRAILTCHEEEQNDQMLVKRVNERGKSGACFHVQLASKCGKTAKPCSLDSHSLSNILASCSFTIPLEIRDELTWLAAEVSENSSPMVQRVSKNTLVVKCKRNPDYPLGYLHICFNKVAVKRGKWEQDKTDYQYVCECSKEIVNISSNNESSNKKCAHYFACLCAFTNEETLADEFSHIIELEKPLILRNGVNTSENEKYSNDILDSSQFFDVVLTEDISSSDFQLSNQIIIENMDLASNITVPKVEQPDMSINGDLITSAEFLLIDDYESNRNSGLLTSNKRSNMKNVLKRKKSKLVTTKIDVTKHNQSGVVFMFDNWLATVTESMNQSMYTYIRGLTDQMCRVQPLTFIIPNVFFDCLCNRISPDVNKKPMPIIVEQIQRSQPFGVFTQYSFHILNVFHLKRIFETDTVPLHISKDFYLDERGLTEVDDDETTSKTPRIRPYGVKAYLKVGSLARNQTKPYPFVIEWIPDLITATKCGQVTFKFEHSHTDDTRCVVLHDTSGGF